MLFSFFDFPRLHNGQHIFVHAISNYSDTILLGLFCVPFDMNAGAQLVRAGVQAGRKHRVQEQGSGRRTRPLQLAVEGERRHR